MSEVVSESAYDVDETLPPSVIFQLPLARADSAFDADGQLTDEDARRRLGRFINGFVDHCRMTAR